MYLVMMDRRKALIELPGKEQVRRAVQEMCFFNIRGMRLKVDVPYFLPHLRQEVLGSKAHIGPSKKKKPKPPQVMGKLKFHSLLLLQKRFSQFQDTFEQGRVD
jgi:hypothetical protein